MRRDIEKDFLAWKSDRERYPLILRGARQVGKSYLVESFGKSRFENCVTVNFEFQPQLQSCFQSLDPSEIVGKLKLLLGAPIQEERTLLFLDEIQECPRAITALRYFKEKMAGLAVVAAGSLFEFAARDADFRMPVGRIQFLYMTPLTFAEYLDATDNGRLRQYLADVAPSDDIDDAIHEQLLRLLRSYLIVGGMPAVVNAHVARNDPTTCRNIQAGLLQTYRSDFGKYASIAERRYLDKVFDAAPRMAGQRIKYSTIDAESRSRDLKNALNLLTLAGVVRPVYAATASGLPLGAQIDERKFKLNFLDVGLMQYACGLPTPTDIDRDIPRINAGSVAEQFVGQELAAMGDRHRPSELYYWAREKRGSSAEVDFVVAIGTSILPVEVKSGKEGRLRSLRLFMKEKGAKLGIRFSREKLSYHDNILSIPLYMVEQWERLVGAALQR